MTPRFSFLSLRTRLMALVLLAIFPLLILIFINAAEQRSAAAGRAQSEALRVALFAVSSQAQFIEQTRQFLVNLTQSPELSSGETPACNEAFTVLRAQYLQQQPRYLNLGLIDPDGRIYCSIQPVSGSIYIANRDYFQRALQTLSFSFGDYEYDPSTDETFVNFVYPVLDFSSRPRVILFATLDLNWLNQLAVRLQLPANSTVTVLDRNGKILIHYPEPERRVGQTLPETPIVEMILARRAEGTAEAVDIDGIQRLYAFTPLAGVSGGLPSAYISVGIPSESVYAEGDRLLILNLVTLGAVTVFALGATWIAGGFFILRPVHALVQATRRLSAGDLSTRIGQPAAGERGEIAQLAQAFDHMAESLQQRQTERDRAEAALRKSEELYRTLARNFPNGAVILFDRDLRYTIADGAGLAEVGLSKEALEGKTVHEIFPPDIATLLEPRYRAALAGNTSAFEVPFSDRIYLVYSLPVRNEQGHIVAGMTMTHDITERHRAEEALETSEARFRSAFDDAAIGMALVSTKGRYLEVNQAYCALVGFAEGELLNMTFQAITHPDDLQADLSLFHDLLAGRVRHYEMEKRLIRKLGGEAWVLLSVSLVRDARGRPLYAVSQVQDVTQRKHAEQRLREQEQQYRGIFESTSDGLVINDIDTGHMVEVNPAFCAMHGYSRDELLQADAPILIHPDSLPLFAEYVETVRAGRPFEARAVDVRKDGTPFHVEVRGSRLAYSGKPHILGVVRDITERVQAYQLLEQRVAERTRELSTLLEVSHNVASTLELKPLLGLILDQLKIMVDYVGATIFTLQDDELVILDYRGPLTTERARRLRFRLAQAGANRRVIQTHRPVIIDDVRGDSDLAREFQRTAGEDLLTKFGYIRCWLGVPLMIKEWVVGMMSVDHGQPGFFTDRHAELTLAIANQAAIAIENARLYAQAQALAALEERQKLARELHDSVSQALYGIALGARTARTLLDREPSRVAEPIEYVLSLAEAGLAEMRALIFELRPESLETEGLVAALAKQAASVRARHTVEVQTEFCDEPPLPLDVKTALYRVAQEALHNTVKHARATRIDLRLECFKDEGRVNMEVRDNGRGFDPGGSFPGHLGLRSMRERVEKIGGDFQVESTPGGTSVRVQVLVNRPSISG